MEVWCLTYEVISMKKDVMIVTGAGQPGAADEFANIAALLMSEAGASITC